MSFPIQFHYNNEPMNKITKKVDSTTLQYTLDGVLRDESSVVDPVVIVECANPIIANYAYIEAFNRYYYIKEVDAYRDYTDNQNPPVNHKLWRISMHTDVLKTFSQGILGSPCIIARSSSQSNQYLNDNQIKCYQNPIVGFQAFPKGFDLSQSQFVLAIFGDREQ